MLENFLRAHILLLVVRKMTQNDAERVSDGPLWRRGTKIFGGPFGHLLTPREHLEKRDNRAFKGNVDARRRHSLRLKFASSDFAIVSPAPRGWWMGQTPEGNRFWLQTVARPLSRVTGIPRRGYLRLSGALLFHEFQCKNAGRLARGRKRRAGDARPAESPHNPQFRPVHRVKISPFREQEASHGLILTPLGMTPRVRRHSQVARHRVCAVLPPPFLFPSVSLSFFLSLGAPRYALSLREKVDAVLEIIFQLCLYI